MGSRNEAKHVLRVSVSELGSPAIRYSHIHARHHAPDPSRAQRQLRDHQDSSGSRIHVAHASRRSLRVSDYQINGSSFHPRSMKFYS